MALRLRPDGKGGFVEAGPSFGTILVVLCLIGLVAAYAIVAALIALWCYCLYRNWKVTLALTATLVVASKILK